MADANSGPGWYEVINPRNATTNIAYVHENGDLYLPEGDAGVTPDEFAFAAAQGKAHRLIRADEGSDLCSNCMTMERQRAAASESSRHNGAMYVQAKHRWYEASDALTRVKDLCDGAEGPTVSVADVRSAAKIRPLPAKERRPYSGE